MMQYLLGESLLTRLIETLKNSTRSLLVDTANYTKFITLKKSNCARNEARFYKFSTSDIGI